MEYRSKKYCVGSVYKTNEGGNVTIIGKADIGERYYCQFNDSNKVVKMYGVDAIKSGRMKNPYKPRVYGVGFLGVGDAKAWVNNKDTKEYCAWNKMLQRCYSDIYHKKRPTYVGCKVIGRWHNFQNFCRDIKELENYSEWKKNKIKYHLDKDIKIKGNKIYSKETCMFVTARENSAEANKTDKIYIATRISDGYEEEFIIQTDFAKKYNLSSRHMYSCWMGKRKQHKGWNFRIK